MLYWYVLMVWKAFHLPKYLFPPFLYPLSTMLYWYVLMVWKFFHLPKYLFPALFISSLNNAILVCSNGLKGFFIYLNTFFLPFFYPPSTMLYWYVQMVWKAFHLPKYLFPPFLYPLSTMLYWYVLMVWKAFHLSKYLFPPFLYPLSTMLYWYVLMVWKAFHLPKYLFPALFISSLNNGILVWSNGLKGFSFT